MARLLAGLVGFGFILAGVSAQPPPPPLIVEAQPAPAPPPPPAEPLPVDPPIAFVVPGGPKPGLFGGIDFSALFPHVKNDVRGSVAVAPFGFFDEVRLPEAPLDAALAPKFTLGWRLDSDRGAIQVTYRNLATEGAAWLANFDA